MFALNLNVNKLGTTFTTGLRRFLNEIEVKDEYKEMLQTTHKSFIRLKLIRIEMFILILKDKFLKIYILNFRMKLAPVNEFGCGIRADKIYGQCNYDYKENRYFLIQKLYMKA